MDRLQHRRDNWRTRVFETADALDALGLKPTRSLILARIGGSANVIGPLLTEWWDKKSGAVPSVDQTLMKRMLEEIDAGIARHFQKSALDVIARMGFHSLRLKDVANRHDSYVAAHDREMTACQEREATARATNATLAARLEAASAMHYGARSRRNDIAAEIRALEAHLSELKSEIAQRDVQLMQKRSEDQTAAAAHAKDIESQRERITRAEDAQTFARATPERLVGDIAPR